MNIFTSTSRSKLTMSEKIKISRNRLAYFAKTHAPEIVVELEKSHLRGLVARARAQVDEGLNRLAKAVGI